MEQININKQRLKLKNSSSSNSLVSRTRKISAELQRPLKRATSLTYRVFTPTQMIMPMDYPEETNNNALSASSSLNSITKLSRKWKSLRRSKSISKTSPLSTSPSIQQLNNYTFNYTPPSSPNNTFSSSDESENDDDFSRSDGPSQQDECDFTANTTYSSCHTSPASNRTIPKFNFSSGNFFQYDSENILKDFGSDLFETSSLNDDHHQVKNPFVVQHQIFKIPEILEIILRYVSHDYTDFIPNEPKIIRRPPLSYNHSLILYGEDHGEKIWKRTVSGRSVPTSATRYSSSKSNIYNCLTVNKLWNSVMLSILNENLYFENDFKFEKFTSTLLTSVNSQFNGKPKPLDLNLHKIKSPQSILEIFSSQISSEKLESISFYICPNLLPPIQLISKNLKKISLPGCKNLNDNHLSLIVSKTPNLVELDIRACEQITDTSIYFISQNCKMLEVLNLGRHKRGELISDISIGHLARNCLKLKTLGLAGCGISDWSIWEIAINLNHSLERLSVNNCWKLTDMGVCNIFRENLLNNLTVLEIRNINLNSVEELFKFRERKLKKENVKVLIEACEKIDYLLKIYGDSQPNTTSLSTFSSF